MYGRGVPEEKITVDTVQWSQEKTHRTLRSINNILAAKSQTIETDPLTAVLNPILSLITPTNDKKSKVTAIRKDLTASVDPNFRRKKQINEVAFGISE